MRPSSSHIIISQIFLGCWVFLSYAVVVLNGFPHPHPRHHHHPSPRQGIYHLSLTPINQNDNVNPLLPPPPPPTTLTTTSSSNRRTLLKKATSAFLLAIPFTTTEWVHPPPSNAAAAATTAAANPQDLSENEFIRQLKAKSDANRAAAASPSFLSTPEDLSEGNEFIRQLQAKSDANRERNLKEAQRPDKLSPEQFLGQYDKPKFVSIRRTDGSTKMVDPVELEELLSAGVVRVENEIGVTRDGKQYEDYSRRYNMFVGVEESVVKVVSVPQ